MTLEITALTMGGAILLVVSVWGMWRNRKQAYQEYIEWRSKRKV